MSIRLPVSRRRKLNGQGKSNQRRRGPKLLTTVSLWIRLWFQLPNTKRKTIRLRKSILENRRFLHSKRPSSVRSSRESELDPANKNPCTFSDEKRRRMILQCILVLAV